MRDPKTGLTFGAKKKAATREVKEREKVAKAAEKKFWAPTEQDKRFARERRLTARRGDRARDRESELTLDVALHRNDAEKSKEAKWKLKEHKERGDRKGPPVKYATEGERTAAKTDSVEKYRSTHNWHCDACDKDYSINSKSKHLSTKKHIANSSK